MTAVRTYLVMALLLAIATPLRADPDWVLPEDITPEFAQRAEISVLTQTSVDDPTGALAFFCSASLIGSGSSTANAFMKMPESYRAGYDVLIDRLKPVAEANQWSLLDSSGERPFLNGLPLNWACFQSIRGNGSVVLMFEKDRAALRQQSPKTFENMTIRSIEASIPEPAD
ncbi:hypothetical protein CKO28_01290 [Rhodovibrio sodomensis]|uniref:Uncharacterized protein n=1 Tax=Rhodovibrio sodomensis TaxID=1088 RepID=A0ABS1DAQ3_9PROT|nr:hypothetical protein [Rhodovibrio sodomensis]MBK1666678.1 hypothetical protein [Rhodovibrio sodomensis]